MDELSKTLCSSSYAKDNGVLLYNNDVYIREDTPALALLEVRRVLGRAFVPVTVTPEAFDEMLAKIWQQSSGVSQQLVDDMDADIDLMALTEEIPDNEDLLDNDENSPVIRLINAILGEAVKDGASDIHIETFERTLSIRFRVDGVLRPVLQPARKLAPLLVSRIKVMSKLDIAENVCRRMAVSHCALAARRSTCASRPFRPSTASAWSCACSIKAISSPTSTSWA